MIASDKVEGTRVYDRAGNKLGSVMNFMLDKRSGQVEYAVLEFAGFLGMDRNYYPLPWDMLEYDTEQGGYVVDLDKDRLENAPRYSEVPPTFHHAYGEQVYGYHGLAFPV